MEILEGSYGGRHGLDGMDTVDTLYANTRNNPIEDIESHLPLRVQRYELREDMAAPGEWRGGIGSVREFVYLTDGGFSVEGDGHKYKPWGFDGGADGAPSALVQVTAGGRDASNCPRKCPTARRRRATGSSPTGRAAAATATARARAGSRARQRARRPHLAAARARAIWRRDRRRRGRRGGDRAGCGLSFGASVPATRSAPASMAAEMNDATR